MHRLQAAGRLCRGRLASLGQRGIQSGCGGAGAFKLAIEGGMAAYTAARPAVALVTSAAVERNAVIGDDVAARKADIPIVQLNPAGSLNWKYKGEVALRESGVSCAPRSSVAGSPPRPPAAAMIHACTRGPPSGGSSRSRSTFRAVPLHLPRSRVEVMRPCP